MHASYQAVVRTDQRPEPWCAGTDESGLIRITKTILSGCEPRQAQEQAAALAPAELRDLAVQLAADPDLTVSVISYDDGRHELAVMHTSAAQHTEDTIDRHRFTRQPGQAAPRALSITTPAALQDAVTAIRGILQAATT